MKEHSVLLKSTSVILIQGILLCGCSNTPSSINQPTPERKVVYSALHPVGTGNCTTNRGRIIQSGEKVLIEVFRPSSQQCGFKEIYAYIGSKAYYLKDATEGFVKNSSGGYTWNSTYGFLVYDVGRTISYSEASSIKLHESSCTDSSCVTNFPERLAKSSSGSSRSSSSSNNGNSEGQAAAAALGVVAAGAIIYGVGKWLFSGSSGGGSSYSGGSSNSNTQSKSNQQSISVRSQDYDNAGRKTEGFWVKCGSKSEERIYRSAWDSSRDWYRPGFPTPYFIAKGSLTLEEVSRKICM